ncbi:hypothetical protein A6R68_19266, partial [Neotoma lepida]
APRFKGFQQQDSQELLHHLLDAVRTEETKRIQASILKAFNNPTPKTADDETRKKISTMKDPFIDISLPIIEERITRFFSLKNTVNLQNQLSHDRKPLRNLPSGEDKTVVMHQKNENSEGSGFASIMSTELSLNESPTDGSEKEASLSESSADADSEASESESTSKQTVLFRSSGDSCGHTDQHLHLSLASELTHSTETHSGDEEVAEAIAGLHLGSTVLGNRDCDREKQPLNVPNNLCFSEGKHMRFHSAQNAFQTLSQSYVTTSKECSVQSCLYQFTSMELLMGNNKLLCEDCTEKKQKCPKETSSAGLKEPDSELGGHWVHVSDTYV